ncbi:hypothetical protein FAZ95_36920 [Trinickia violacea]|uniref:Uncharacterized protein n=1 Tax=Trinickia violacea TaxID=2571746 RepID=A0A4P8J3L0_9BURK|nr:DUF3824 domain-containing protein [Trinickia violacea]QCP54484.1 hypothetical protein FAZ95_36920 [Trinickia violacea]
MKMGDRLQVRTAGPVWGLIFGVFLTSVGMGLWIYATALHRVSQQDESLAVAAAIIGVFLVVYAAHELRSTRQRQRALRERMR